MDEIKRLTYSRLFSYKCGMEDMLIVQLDFMKLQPVLNLINMLR